MLCRVAVQTEDFSVAQLNHELVVAAGTQAGATVSFVGRVRGGTVLAMYLEHYPGMTESVLADIAQHAVRRWELAAVSIVHRIGRLLPGEQIVWVGAAAAHRQAAFQAVDFMMDFLKTQAPFWKKEETSAGSHWVDAREQDARALGRWVEPE